MIEVIACKTFKCSKGNTTRNKRIRKTRTLVYLKEQIKTLPVYHKPEQISKQGTHLPRQKPHSNTRCPLKQVLLKT